MVSNIPPSPSLPLIGDGIELTVVNPSSHDMYSSVKITNLGAHIISWCENVKGCQKDLLFLSKNAVFDGSKAIRGGVPICWPQFANQGPLPLIHGFARVSHWTLQSQYQNPFYSEATFGLKKNQESFSSKISIESLEWPYQYSLSYTVRLTGWKDSILESWFNVTNNDQKKMEFTLAFHPYFKINNIQKCDIIGMPSCSTYNKNIQKDQNFINSTIRIDSPTDIIYYQSPASLTLYDKEQKSAIKINSDLPDHVIWNPFNSFAEVTQEEVSTFICVENVYISHPISLLPSNTFSTHLVYQHFSNYLT